MVEGHVGAALIGPGTVAGYGATLALLAIHDLSSSCQNNQTRRELRRTRLARSFLSIAHRGDNKLSPRERRREKTRNGVAAAAVIKRTFRQVSRKTGPYKGGRMTRKKPGGQAIRSGQPVNPAAESTSNRCAQPLGPVEDVVNPLASSGRPFSPGPRNPCSASGPRAYNIG
jgi:hypothetical protein